MTSEDDTKYDTYDNLIKDDGSGEVKVWRIEDFEKVRGAVYDDFVFRSIFLKVWDRSVIAITSSSNHT
jgi:hypothetical protein